MLEMIGYVIWSSIRSGLRPGQSVKTITCTSERSGMASSGLVRSDHTPKAVAKKTRKRTMNRLWALYSMTRLIISYAPQPPTRMMNFSRTVIFPGRSI